MSQFKDDQTQSSTRGMMIGFLVCVVMFFGYDQYIRYRYPEYTKARESGQLANNQQGQSQQAQTNQVSTTNASDASTMAASGSPASLSNPASGQHASMPAQTISDADLTFKTKSAELKFLQQNAAPASIQLTQYKQDNTPSSPAVELMDSPLKVFPAVGSENISQVSNIAARREGHELTFERTSGSWQIIQTWKIPEEGYIATVDILWINKAADAQKLDAQIFVEMGANALKPKASFFNPGTPGEETRFLSQVDGSDSFEAMTKFCEDRTKEVKITNKLIDFFGFDHHYFGSAFIPNEPASYLARASSVQTGSICSVTTVISKDFGNVAAGQSATSKWTFWYGPKDAEIIASVNPKLKTTLGLGWLDMIAQPLLLSIKGLYKMFGNYGVAIIILTLILKVLFYPLAKQAAVSAAKMKKLNPEMTKLREKYKADPQRMQMELMKFMSQHKINPMKGCLPILPTIPVFFALFRVLSASIELRHAPFFGWILDLSSKDPYFITPIILTGCMFVQQKLTPMTGMDPTQEKVMLFMPVIFGVMMISLPSGLVLYMLTNTIVSIAQQQYLNRKLAATV